jgi:hypothetical protein
LQRRVPVVDQFAERRSQPACASFQADVRASALLVSPFESAGIPSTGWSSTNAPVTLSRAGFPVSLVKPAAVEHSRTSLSTYAGR